VFRISANPKVQKKLIASIRLIIIINKMKNRKNKNNYIDIIIFTVFLLFFFQDVNGQNYYKLKITTNDGNMIIGKSGSIDNSSVSLLVNGQKKSFKLSDIQIIMSKKGSAVKWALGCGGSCLTYSIVDYVLVSMGTLELPAGSSLGIYAAFGVLRVGLATVLGAGIGAALDGWKLVYTGYNSAILNKFRLNLDSDQNGHFLIGLSYSL